MSNSSQAPYSLVIITLNAAEHIEKCILSAPQAAEVIVVDSGSTDDTTEICKNLGARLIHQTWLGFGPQKQFAVEQAKHDWVLCLDADESLTPTLNNDINKQLTKPKRQCYRLARCNQFMGKELRHGGGYPDWNLRLFNRKHAHWSSDLVHEHIIFDGTPGTLKGDLLHDSATTLTDYLQKQNAYTNIQAELIAASNKSVGVSKLVLSPLVRFIREYFFKLGFLDGVAGFTHIAIASFFSLIKYAKAIELRRQKAKLN